MVLMGRRSGRRSDLIEAYAICKDITKAASTSFLRSFRHLPLEKRNAVYALYAFCRRVDDIADGDWLPDLSGIGPEEMSDLDARTVDRSVILSIDKQSEGSNPEPDHSLKLRALIHFRDMLTRAHEGHSVSDPIFVALKDTFNRFPIRVSDLHQLIDGMEDDLYPTNYRSFEDLRGYCYKVASTVGLSLIEIYGYENPDAREHAEEMGIFLQMVNILRDIQEDLGRGRVYLPKDELELFGISNEDLYDSDLPTSRRWKEFMRHYISRVRTHQKNAVRLLPLIESDSRSSPSIMASVYAEVLDEAERRNGDVLSRRLSLGFMKKMSFAFSTLMVWSFRGDD
ncbi:MAG: hypothetical protein CMB63_03140 [Euryarchaeota archaeon]|mgnify:FL=1|nr:hypothetical protein [Euryarchaeota archaeon]|tara:strand:+ start:4886 stop:5905 length:1020 start_codon:yes stop_codon:yes gene_type:complete